MSRGVLFLIVIILLLVGGMFLLSSNAREVPVTIIETDVSTDASAR